jgi:hypothetical protein
MENYAKRGEGSCKVRTFWPARKARVQSHILLCFDSYFGVLDEKQKERYTVCCFFYHVTSKKQNSLSSSFPKKMALKLISF